MTKEMMDYKNLHQTYREASLNGRYISPDHISPLISASSWNWSIAGESVTGRPVFKISVGRGATRILLWSQMHGNESTTTKALFDVLNFLHGKSAEAELILNNLQIISYPMLNPDGAAAYTRENANHIDLNRDFQDRSQPETLLLLNEFEEFNPTFCFNLHDQRTIYGVGDSDKPATVSFLAPAYDQERQYNQTRLKAVGIINEMNRVLQKEIPGQVGRFDDGFNPNCVGDTFMSRSVPTVLFEAGHFPGDWQREKTRYIIFSSILSAFKSAANPHLRGGDLNEYLNIPQNKVSFYDFVYKKIKIDYDNSEIITNFAAQYTEVLTGREIAFSASIVEIGDLPGKYGHYQFDGESQSFKCINSKEPVLGEPADFFIGETQFRNGEPVSEKSNLK